MPELLLRVVTDDTDPNPTDRRTTTGRDVIVAADPDHSVGELILAIAARLGVDTPHCIVPARTGQTLYADLTLADVDLVSGDEIVFSNRPGHDARPQFPPRRAVAVDVIAGPDSGRSQFLAPGRITIGRSSSADLAIDDPSVSRHHVSLEVSAEWRVTIDPSQGSANGVFVNDVEVTEPTVITAADVVGLGGTRLAIRPFERGERRHVDQLGQLDFHRTPYRPPVVAERETEPIGPIPTRPEPRRFQMLAVLAPLAAGLLMYTFTRQIQFLALTLISPIVMIGNSVDERRSGRRSFTTKLADFRASLIERRAAFEQMRHLERAERLRAAPDVADLARRAELRTIDLWSRGRRAPDFLHVRLGLGTDAVRFPIELERGGDDDLRQEALAAMAGLDTIGHVPVMVDLAAESLGIHGDTGLVDGVTDSLLVQAATLHSPEDLIVLAAVSPERPLGWMKWLPHLRSVTSPVPGNHLATDLDEANSLISRLIEVATFRTADRRQGETRWPRLLLVLDTSLGADPAETSRLAELATDADISIVWLAPCAADVPRHATRILDVRRDIAEAMVARLWATDPEVADRHLDVEHLRPELAERVARSLAPIRDASTGSLATSIPRTAPLLDVLGVGKPDAAWVAKAWSTDHEYALRFPIGIGVDGPLELDLVHDGPHTLIGGTSGAGKSELLQSMVAGLAARYSPARLNFLFVDYKGGASSQVFERLPHTVGYVTNLSAALSLRALTSLRAELNRRMAVMEGRAKDLAEMLERFPDEAPASLVIVVDEFATLVKEVPEFVAGVIDIAQRGRSLGIHLVLATQRPSGSVNENILANTNLRISLRMLDRAESTAIIDSPEAADIPVPLRGRGLARLGPRRLVEFQSAFAGAPLAAAAVRPPVIVGPFDRTDDTPQATASMSVADTGATHLAVLLDAIVDANQTLSIAEPRRPWRDVLPDRITLADVLDEAGFDAMTDPGRFVTIGMLDAPERQEQRPAVIDLEEGGGWLIFGSGGAGKTSVLRTVAASITSTCSGDDVALLGLDFASRGLAGLRALPEMIDVTTGDDLEAVTRHLAVLDAELDRRRRVLAEAGAETLTAYRRVDSSAAMPRIVILIDGFGGLMSTLAETGGGMLSSNDQWIDIVQRLVIDGRQVGIHAVITADRRNAIPSRLHAAVANRLILRHAEETSYTEHGIKLDTARQLDQLAGRGLIDGTTLVQIACVAGGDDSARAQNAAIAALGDQLDRRRTTTLATAPLPESIAAVDAAPTPMVTPMAVPIGVADVTGRTVQVDLAWSHLAVCGPARSGRSTALATVVEGLLAGGAHDVFVVGQSSSPLAAVAGDRSAFGRPDVLAPFLDRLANQVAMGSGERPRVLVIDDVDALDDPALTMIWERLAGFDDLRLVMSLESRAMSGYTSSALVNLARRARRLLVLQPDDPSEYLQITGSKLALRLGVRLPAGRGVFIADRQPTTLQVAHLHGSGSPTKEGCLTPR